MRHLHEDFTYTLDRPATPRGQSVLLDFLLVHREGHCEFFASAFVVLARALGIPARLVAGYRVVEHNGFGGYAVVRAKHAHAWGEAYVPVASDPTRSAFEVFDPTPAAPTLAESSDRTVAAFFDYLWTSLGRILRRGRRDPGANGPRARWRRARRVRGARAAQSTPARPTRSRTTSTRRPTRSCSSRRDSRRKGSCVTGPRRSSRSPYGSRSAGASLCPRALRRYARARYGVGEVSERDLARALEPGGD